MKYPKYPSSRSAFSLIEVTIALGIIAFGLIALLGLLPTGMNLARESRSESVGVNILSALAADLQREINTTNQTRLYQIPLSAGASGSTFFDEDGRWLGATSTANTPGAVYAGTWAIRARSSTTPPNALVRVSWPAQAPQSSGMVEALVVLKKDPSSTP